MELSRLLRIARARWWLFVALAGVGLVAGFVITSVSNSRIKPEFEAIAPVLFTFENDDDRQTGLQNLVEAAMDLAEDANADNIGPLAIIRIDPEDVGIIQFVGLARNEADAQTTALLLRDTYINAARARLKGSQSEREAEIERLDSALATIEEEINGLNQDLQADPDLVVRVDELTSDRESLERVLDDLEIELLLGPDTNPQEDEPRTVEDVEAEIQIVEDRIAEIDQEISSIAVPSSDVLSEKTRRLEILNDQYNTLLNDYTAILLEVEPPEPFTLGITETIDNTTEPASEVLAGILGLIVGTGLSVGIVILADRARQTVWVGSDLGTMPVLAELPPRNPLRVAGQLWYELGGPPQRRRAVQAMRVTVESGLGGTRANLGFAGVNSPPEAVHALAADFAMSMVTSGNRVLLIDANFDNPAELAEFDGLGPTFSEVLAHRMDDEESFRSFVKRAVTETKEIRPGLVAMRVGEGLGDPADALASRRLAIMLEEVGDLFDMTIVTTSDATETTAQTVLNRLDHVIFAIRPGRTTAPMAEALHAQLNSFGVGVMGAVLVMKASRSDDGLVPTLPASEPPSPRRRDDEEDPVDAVVAAMQRQRAKAGPAAKAESAAPPRVEAKEVANPTPAPKVDALPAPVPVESAADLKAAEIVPIDLPLAAGGHEDRTPAVTGNGHVALDHLPEMMETTIYHIVQGFSGVAGTQRFDPGIREVTKYGFVPLVRIKGHKTLGSRVLDSLADGLDDDSRRRLQADLISFFAVEPGGRTSERVATAINHWTAEHFFTRHLAQTGREPEIWHVSSPGGTFQALTHFKRATKERIDLLRAELLRRQLDTLNRHLKMATKNRKNAQIRRLEDQIKDVRTFDIALGWLFEGTTPNARIWYPWKPPEQQPQGWDPNFDEGIRANVAPLQRLGLLVQDVLTEEELVALTPPG